MVISNEPKNELTALVIVARVLGKRSVDIWPETRLSISILKAVDFHVVKGIAPELLEDGAVLESSKLFSLSGYPRLNSNLVKGRLSSASNSHIAPEGNIKFELIVFDLFWGIKEFFKVFSNGIGKLSVISVSSKRLRSTTTLVKITLDRVH
jgi:hypothetical protein